MPTIHGAQHIPPLCRLMPVEPPGQLAAEIEETEDGPGDKNTLETRGVFVSPKIPLPAAVRTIYSRFTGLQLRNPLNTKSCSLRWLWQEKHAALTGMEVPWVRSSPANTSNPQPPVLWYRVASFAITATLFLGPSKVAPASWRSSRRSSTTMDPSRKRPVESPPPLARLHSSDGTHR